MTEAVVAPDTGLQFRLVHSAALDPLFEAARYTFSVEGATVGFEVTVRFAPIFVHLLPLSRRGRLADLAEGVARQATAAGVRERAVVRVSSDGTPTLGALRLEPLLPLRAPA